MILISRSSIRRVICALVSLSMLLQPLGASAALLNLVKTPLFVTPPIPPLVMLDISKDQQLHKKAYNDYSDLDNDGKLETTYKHSIDYYGYFDSYKCYNYVAGNALEGLSHYAPSAWTADKYCDGTKWSGNFLNWATMTRMDSVRKLLFGGLRRQDVDPSVGGWSYGSTTLLERSYLPADAHAFAKWYGGSDVNRLSPFGVQTTPTVSGPVTTGNPVPVVVAASQRVEFQSVPAAFAASLSPGDQIRATAQNVTGGNGKQCQILGRMVFKDTAANPTIRLWVDVGGSFVELDFSTTPPTPIATSTGSAAALNCVGPFVGGPTSNQWVFENLSTTGISICNVTPGSITGVNQFSHTNTFTPRMRMVKGNYELWAASERRQCQWQDDYRDLQGGFLPALQRPSSNGNQLSLSGLAANAENPANSVRAFTEGGGVIERRSLGFGVDAGEYRVMVEACHAGFAVPPPGQKTTEKCKSYQVVGGTSYYKPIGLLQVYGDDGRINFGLMTGSYSKNTSGGVLRKNPGGLNDEVSGTTGRFSAAPPNGSIIGTLSRLRMYGYDYNDGTYIGQDGNCTYQLVSSQLVDNMCRTWGNPMSEIYMESLRYFAGHTAPTGAFATNGDAALFPATGPYPALTQATWPNPNNVLTNANYCAPLNILTFNASISSKDSSFPQNPALNQISNPFRSAGITQSPVQYTNTVGTAEGLGTGSYFIGNTAIATATDGTCTAKPGGGGGISLGNVEGICPEAPSLNGGYLMAGMAFAAKTNRIRDDLTSVPATDKTSLKVNTYGIALGTNVPRIEIPVPGGAAGQKVVIQPVYRLDRAGNGTVVGAGAIVDVKIVFQAADGNSGRMYVNWEDSEQGGDYDQDVWGVIDYKFSGGKLKVTTKVVAASTANPQGFGYVISGTTQDGPHFHSGIYGFSFSDPTNIVVTNNPPVPLVPTVFNDPVVNATDPYNGVPANTAQGPFFINSTGGCRRCAAADVATTATYTLNAAGAGKSLQDPLWFAAKYGGFTDSGNNGANPLPDVATEWDNFNNATGALGSDGVPDNFYAVSNPLGLEAALDKLFVSILQTSAASAVAANSSKLNTSTRIYQAVFNPSDWSGKILAFGVNAGTGVPNTTPDWDGGQISLNPATISPSTRTILTFNKGVASGAPLGIKFSWPSNPASPTGTELSPAQITALNRNPDSATADGLGQSRLSYLRGDAANEGIASTNFRRRPTTKLGDIINSNPNFVGPPAAGYPDATYKAFAATYANRKPMLYVGANDGMLHGFDSGLTGSPGTELLAYVPSSVYRNLSKLTSRVYSHEYFADGSPVVEDAFVGTAWKSVLVAGLNRGGQGVYALDVTDPTRFSDANAGSLVMWEFTDADDPDLGYTFGTPVIRKMSNGKWAAIVSGGFNNSQGSAADPAEAACASGTGTIADPYVPNKCSVSRTGYGYIFIILLDGPTGTAGKWTLGTDYFKVSTSTGDVATPNGLASPFAADINGDGAVDFIYSGDLLGGLWKFDVRGASTTWMDTASNRVRLFNAVDSVGNPQPITSGVEAVLHPTGNGIIVSFGTGKYLEANDINPPGPAYRDQSIYGIWDLNDGATVSVQSTVASRSVLMPQILQPGITNIVTNPDGSISRITTKHQPNYTASNRASPDATLWDGAAALADKIAAVSNVQNTLANQRGWFLDLFNGTPAAAPLGERVVFAPFVKNGIVFFSSLWPLANVCLGSTAGDNITLMIATGARPDASVFDITGDQAVNASDLVTVGVDGSGNPIKIAVSSRRIDGGSAQPPTLVSKGSVDIGYQNTTSGNLATGVYSFGRGPGRVSWREILY